MEQMWKMFGGRPQRRKMTTKRRDTGLPQMMPGRVRDPSTWRSGQVTSKSGKGDLPELEVELGVGPL